MYKPGRPSTVPPVGSIPYTVLQADDELAAFIARLHSDRITRLAIDVEGENNLHSYGIHVALIQLFDGTRGAIVDALAIRDRSLMKELLEEAPWTLVWFDAANDLLSFQHALDIRPSPIRDLAIAARLLGRQGGLHAMTGQPGSSSAKDRFQRSNWMRRPLSKALLDYAISDVTHLLQLDDTFSAELSARGLGEEFTARNRAAQEAERTWDPLSNFVRIPGYHRLSPAQQRSARLLWYARELYGKQADLPPGNVASKQDLRAIIDKNLHRARDIADFLNKDRRAHRIVAQDLEARLAEAETLLQGQAAQRPSKRG